MKESKTEGFDLDAISASQENSEDVVYELGGGATVSSNPSTTNTNKNTAQSNDYGGINDDDATTIDPIAKSEALKTKGNTCFKEGNYLDAIDYYTDAIEACPCPGGMTGESILEMEAKHEEQEREKANQRYQRDTDRRMSSTRRRHRNKSNLNQQQGGNGDDGDGDGDGSDSDNHDNDNDNDNDSKHNDNDDLLAPKEFIPPKHEYGKSLSIYYSNKAACLINLDRLDEASKDCNLAIMLNPNYVKAYIRRMICYEKMDKTDHALNDAKAALACPNNCISMKQKTEIRNHIHRLQKIEDARMEKMKEETMGKLKDLGNSILGNFGMSLDNFKAEKDPNTGSYSIRMG